MPPKETPENQFTERSKIDLKKAFNFIPIIILFIWAVALFGLVSLVFSFTWFVWLPLVKVTSHIHNTPDVVVNTYKCENPDYEWQIVGHDFAYGGELFIPPEPKEARTLVLLHQGKVISGAVDKKDEEEYSSDEIFSLPTVGQFDEAFILNHSIWENPRSVSGSYWKDPVNYSYILVPPSLISATDFEMTAKCLYRNIDKINEILLSINKEREQIGGILLQDKSRLRLKTKYTCSDGSNVMSSGWDEIKYYPPDIRYDDYYNPSIKEFIVAMDGKISPYYFNKENLTFLEAGRGPSSVFQGCISPEGESLVDYIHSIPSKIKFFDSDDQAHDLTQVSKIIKNSTSSGISKVDEQAGQASIRIIVPNGGEVLKKNAPININWNEKNIPPNALIYLDLFEISGDHVLLKDDVDSETKYCANCIGGSKAGFTSHHPVGNGGHDVMLEAGKDYYIDNAKPGSHYVLRVEVIGSRECDAKNKINYVGEFDASHCDFLIASDWSDSVFTLSD